MALPALATPEQLAAWMQVDVSALPIGAASALDMVSAIVRAEARTNFVRSTATLRRSWRAGGITLPLTPVVSVDSVQRNGASVDYEWDDEVQRLYVAPWAPVSVAFTYGYGEVPGDVVAVALTAAQRILTNPSDLRQETVGSESITYAAETIGASLAPADKDLLARYRRRVAMVRLV